MDINVTYWKIKRAINRNKKIISRCISITLTVLLLVAVGLLINTVVEADKERERNHIEGKDRSPIKKQPANYEDPGFRLFADNDKYALYADTSTGEIKVQEKQSEKEWYSNPQDWQSDNIAPIKPKLRSQFFITFMNVEKCVELSHNNWTNSIRDGGMTYKTVENGIRFDFAFPTSGVIVPVQYTINENGLIAEVLVNEIQELWSERYLVRDITFLPFFGAGGLEDEGYLMVPDGSGTLIEFNNDKQKSASYVGTVYGENLTLSKLKKVTVDGGSTSLKPTTMFSEQITLPVYGMKCNDNGFLAVITSGDANAKISASTSRKTSSYNQIYSTAAIRDMSNAGMGGGWVFAGGVSSNLNESTEILLEGENYTIQFYFLEKGNADYSAMSASYRQHLEANKQLPNSKLTNKNYLVLDLIGAVSIEKFVMGIKMPVVTALTTYNDVVNIVKELKAEGVENIIINYSGAVKGGMGNKIYTSVKPESKLGSKKEFNRMLEYLKEENVILFLETNPVDLYNNGNGYNGNDVGVKTFFGKYGFQYEYELDSFEVIEKTRWHLLTPQLAVEATLKFAESAEKAKVENISVDRFGTALYSNYVDGKDYISRTGTMKLWESTLAKLQESSDYVLIHGGNVFCLPFVDVVTDVSGECSEFDMVDQGIPFYQMTMRGSLLMTGEGINTTVDYDYAFLKSLENGTGLKFNLICADVSELVGTKYNDKTSYSYDFWKDIVVEKYLEMQKVYDTIGNEKITYHECVTSDVTLTVFESASLVVNYGTESYTYNGVEVRPYDYVIIPGGAR